MKVSVIYRHIYLYRAIMNLLYLGGYRKRFADVLELLEQDDRSVLELCFGDIFIAKHCRSTGRKWKGLDINPGFIEYALKKGFDAKRVDLRQLDHLPEADVCVILGSLYHFAEDNCHSILSAMLNASRKIIISEPVVNLSSRSGIIGAIARRSSNVGKGHESFRYTRETFVSMIDDLKQKLRFEYRIVKETGFDVIMVVRHA